MWERRRQILCSEQNLARLGAAEWNKSGPACVLLQNRGVTDGGRVGREGAALPWQGTMRNSLPAWTPSLVQRMLPAIELVSSPWEHGRTLRKNR